MGLHVEATYENGILKLDHPIPLQEHERVVVYIQPKESHARKSAGLLKWTGKLADLDDLIGTNTSCQQ